MIIRTGLMVVVAVILSCTGLTVSAQQTRTAPDTVGVHYSISVEAGEQWSHLMSLGGIMSMELGPQLVLWAEDAKQNHLSTLFVTKRTSIDEWRPDPRNKVAPSGRIEHPEALPFWNRQRIAGKKDAELQSLDAVTSPTPRGDFTLNALLPSQNEPFFLMLEVNVSEDYNESYPKTGRGMEVMGDGQPSLIYIAEIVPTSFATQWDMRLLGISNPDTSTGGFIPAGVDITTARNIIKSITITLLDRVPEKGR